MKHPKCQVDVVWLGYSRGALGWLRQQIEQRYATKAMISLDGELPALVRQGVGRIVVACQDRVGYPGKLMAQLSEQYPEIPTALAVDSWWDGSGRTGLGRTSHLVMPWYRWWDSWVGWLDGSESQLLDPCPGSSAHSRLSRPARAQPTRQPLAMVGRGLIVANCKATAAGWVQLAQQCRLDAISRSPREFYLTNSIDPKVSVGARVPPAPDFILLDDSSLDTTPSYSESLSPLSPDNLAPGHEDAHLMRLVQAAKHRFPDAILCAAVSVPRWRSWERALASGAHEIIVKPNSGLALRRILAERLAQPGT